MTNQENFLESVTSVVTGILKIHISPISKCSRSRVPLFLFRSLVQFVSWPKPTAMLSGPYTQIHTHTGAQENRVACAPVHMQIGIEI